MKREHEREHEREHSVESKWTVEYCELSEAELASLLPCEGFEILRAEDVEKLESSRPVKRHRMTAAGEEVEEAAVAEPSGEGETAAEAKRRRVKQFVTGVLASAETGRPGKKSNISSLLAETGRLGVAVVLDELLRSYLDISVSETQRHVLVQLLERLLVRHGETLAPQTPRLVATLAPTLLDADAAVRTETAGLLGSLAKAVGLSPMLAALRQDVDHADDYVRLAASRVVGVVGEALGVETVLPFVKALCRSRKANGGLQLARQTGMRALQQLCLSQQTGVALLATHGCLSDLVVLIEDVLAGAATGGGGAVVAAALATTAAVAELVRLRLRVGTGETGVERLTLPVAQTATRSRGRLLATALRAASALLGVVEREKAEWLSRELLFAVKRELREGEEQGRRAALRLVSGLVLTGPEAERLWQDLTRAVFGAKMLGVWGERAEVVRAVQRLGEEGRGTEVAQRVASEWLKAAEEELQELGVACVAGLGRGAFEGATARQEEQLVDGLVQAFQSATRSGGTRKTELVQQVGEALRHLGRVRVAARHSQTLANSIRWRLNQPGSGSASGSGTGRRLGAELLTETAELLEETTLRTLGLVAFELLGEEDAETLTWLLRALHATLGRLLPPGAGTGATMIVKEVVPRVTPILRHRSVAVQEAAVEVLGRCAGNLEASEQVGAKEWLRIALELLDTLRAPRKSLRRAAMACVGAIAKTIGPAEVLNPLLNKLKFEERSVKIGAAVGLAVVARDCGAFAVLPALMNEYKSEDLQVRTGVLKAINFTLEMLPDREAAQYVNALTSLLEHALIDRDLVHRHTAAWALKHASLAVVKADSDICHHALRHLLNHLFPNILESAPHMTMAFFDAIDALRLALGPATILNYLLAGLFHPARRVRDAYWRVYNFLLYSSQHALVPAYPRSLHAPEIELII